jgi:rhodanese-related sulfurtransferase
MKLINEKGDYLLIDARPQRLAAKGTIPTAVNIPDTDFEKSADKLPADKTKSAHLNLEWVTPREG